MTVLALIRKSGNKDVQVCVSSAGETEMIRLTANEPHVDVELKDGFNTILDISEIPSLEEPMPVPAVMPGEGELASDSNALVPAEDVELIEPEQEDDTDVDSE